MKLMDLAEATLDRAKRGGAAQVAVSAARNRGVEVAFRDGKLEKLSESTSASLGVALFVEGRYSSHSTSDLRPEALATFVERAISLTRLLGEDKYRGLADPKLYAGRPKDDLQLYDPSFAKLTTERRKEMAEQVEAAARSVKAPIASVNAEYSDAVGESVRLHSNGFSGGHQRSSAWVGATVTMNDSDGRKPAEWHWVGARHLQELPDLAAVGREAAERAQRRLGQKKLPSGKLPIVVDNRTAKALLGHLLSPLYGSALQQKRSFLLDQKGKRIASRLLTLVDEPLLAKGFGSRHFDSDGISAKKRTLLEAGVLREYLIDVYYARKLGVEPTGGSTSNLVLQPGKRSQAQMIQGIQRGVLVTGMIGGNSDVTRGDFSHGIFGFEIRDGKLGGPVGEMNISGNHRELWKRLVEVGNDPYPYTTMLTPSLRFEKVSLSGS